MNNMKNEVTFFIEKELNQDDLLWILRPTVPTALGSPDLNLLSLNYLIVNEDDLVGLSLGDPPDQDLNGDNEVPTTIGNPLQGGHNTGHLLVKFPAIFGGMRFSLPATPADDKEFSYIGNVKGLFNGIGQLPRILDTMVIVFSAPAIFFDYDYEVPNEVPNEVPDDYHPGPILDFNEIPTNLQESEQPEYSEQSEQPSEESVKILEESIEILEDLNEVPNEDLSEVPKEDL